MNSYIYYINNNHEYDEDAVNIVSSEEKFVGVSKLVKGEEYLIHSNNYDAEKSTFEYKYVNVSVPMEKIKFRIYDADSPAAAKAPKKKLVKVKNLVSYLRPLQFTRQDHLSSNSINMAGTNIPMRMWQKQAST